MPLDAQNPLHITPSPATGNVPVASGITPSEAERPLTGREIGLVNDRQDHLMAVESVEGRPPSHRWRLAEWRWMLIVGPVIVILGVSIAIALGAGPAAIAVGVVMSVGSLLLAGWPVLGAGILRGQEEDAARKKAVTDVRVGEDSTQSRR